MFIPNLMFIPRLHGAMHWILNNAMDDDICIHLKVATSKRVFFHIGPIFKTMHIITLKSNMSVISYIFLRWDQICSKYFLRFSHLYKSQDRRHSFQTLLYSPCHFIQIFKKLTLSKFYPDFTLIFETFYLDKIWIKSG